MNGDSPNRKRIPVTTGEVSVLPTENGLGMWMDVENDNGRFVRVFVGREQYDALYSALDEAMYG